MSVTRRVCRAGCSTWSAWIKVTDAWSIHTCTTHTQKWLDLRSIDLHLHGWDLLLPPPLISIPSWIIYVRTFLQPLFIIMNNRFSFALVFLWFSSLFVRIIFTDLGLDFSGKMVVLVKFLSWIANVHFPVLNLGWIQVYFWDIYDFKYIHSLSLWSYLIFFSFTGLIWTFNALCSYNFQGDKLHDICRVDFGLTPI